MRSPQLLIKFIFHNLEVEPTKRSFFTFLQNNANGKVYHRNIIMLMVIQYSGKIFRDAQHIQMYIISIIMYYNLKSCNKSLLKVKLTKGCNFVKTKIRTQLKSRCVNAFLNSVTKNPLKFHGLGIHKN